MHAGLLSHILVRVAAPAPTPAPTPAPAVGAPSIRFRGAKRMYPVRKDGKLLYFDRLEDAQIAMQDAPELQELPKPAPKPVDAPKQDLPEPVPVETVDVQQLEELARLRGEYEAVRRMLAQAEYLALMALFKQMQEEEDVEMLLMAA